MEVTEVCSCCFICDRLAYSSTHIEIFVKSSRAIAIWYKLTII
ncbi:MAG: hypothetical protein V7K42_00200 [Nostoc sp.]